MTGVPIPNTFLLIGPKPLDARSGKFIGDTLPFATVAEAFADVGVDRRCGPGVFVAIGTPAVYTYHRFVRNDPGMDNGWDLVPIQWPATSIIEDANNRFISDAELAAIMSGIDNALVPGEAIANQIAGPQVTANFWIAGKGIFGAGSDTGEQLQVNGTSRLKSNAVIDGGLTVQQSSLTQGDAQFNAKLLVGTGVDNGAKMQIRGGVLSLASNPADYPGVAGAMQYRSDIDRIRAFYAGVWKTLLSDGDAIANQIVAPQTADFWITGKGIFGAGVDNGGQLQVKGPAVIDGNTHIDGKGIIGPGGVDNGAQFQIKGGVASLAANVADFPVIDGGLMYRSDTNKIRAGIAGVWQNLATENALPPATPSTIAGQTIFVDTASPNATDVRTGLNKYSLTQPFKTIQAAANVAVPTDRIYIQSGTYNENVAAVYLNIILGPFVLINGTVDASQRLILRGDYPIGSGDLYGTNEFSEGYAVNYSKITSASANYTVGSGTSPSSVELSSVTGVHIENTGTGRAYFSLRGSFVTFSRIIANSGLAVDAQAWAVDLNNCFVKSTGNVAASGCRTVMNSTVISLGPTGATSHAITGAGRVENSKVYSQNGMACPNASVIRNCFINSFDEISSYATADGTGVHIEIVNNVINVRNPATTRVLFLLFQQNVTDAAYIANNQTNKSSFDVTMNGFGPIIPNIEVNNVFELPFPASTPRIGDFLSPI